MPNLQYIGARYVPIVFDNPDDHSANWKSGVSYENLVIVTYLDDSYTSRKPVPSSVGDPASNPDYWAKTGDFNAALTALSNRVSTIENTDLPNINNAITNLIDEVDRIKWKNKKVLFVSDSYGTFINPSYIDYCVQMLGITDYDNLSVSGTGFTVGAGGTPNVNGFLEQISNYTGTKTDVDAIVVCGGLNDALSSKTDITTGMTNFINYVNANYTSATVYLSFIGCGLDGSVDLHNKNWDKRLTTEMVFKQFKNKSVVYLDIVGALQMTSLMMGSDGAHPSTYGMLYLGEYLANALAGHCMRYTFEQSPLVFTGSANVTAAPSITFFIDNELYVEPQRYLLFSVNDSFELDGHEHSLATFNNLYFNEAVYMNCFAMLGQFDNKTYVQAEIVLKFLHDEVTIQNVDIASDGSGTATHTPNTGGGAIYIYSFPGIKAPLSIMG